MRVNNARTSLERLPNRGVRFVAGNDFEDPTRLVKDINRASLELMLTERAHCGF